MTLIRNQGNKEALKERANNLKNIEFNGIELVIVSVPPGPNPAEAYVEVHFFNDHNIQDILSDPNVNSPFLIFPIFGGHKIKAGPASNEVQVTKIEQIAPANNILKLTLSPVGDYSTYVLSINFKKMDPIFSEIEFKFRPGCFTGECAPEAVSPGAVQQEPSIDYLAKDFDSFRHAMIVAMMERVPGWQPTSEADLDQVLLELFSASGDELSDFQDRCANEAYIARARKRISLVRHARLMDYHVHQGNQSSTWLALELEPGVVDFDLAEQQDWEKRLQVWAEKNHLSSSPITFMSNGERVYFHHLLNRLELYTWSDSMTILKAGSTSADLKFANQTAANIVRDLILDEKSTHLLVQEWLNPNNGKEAGRDMTKRQLLKLLNGKKGAETLQDPITQDWFLRVFWQKSDELKADYCFVANTESGDRRDDVSLFHGNLIELFQGKPTTATFKELGQDVREDKREYHFERTDWGTLCRLPEGPLLHENTPSGGEIAPRSALQVNVEYSSGKSIWREVTSLIHSDENDEDYAVEVDEDDWAFIRFGNSKNGKELPSEAIVRCSYQIGFGPDGNIGCDKLVNFDKTLFPRIHSCWNPFDVTNGKAPEPREDIVRMATESYKHRQQRAVTLYDYADIVNGIEGVERANAAYMWTGSWRTVRISVDPNESKELSEELRDNIARRLEGLKLIGEDFEIRPAIYVPVEIRIKLCIHRNYWERDVRQTLEQDLSSTYTLNGRKAFFHPDNWTFGQELRQSQLAGRIQSIDGIDHVISIEMKRWNERSPASAEVIKVQPHEIITVESNPDHMERGFIDFIIEGGLQ